MTARTWGRALRRFIFISIARPSCAFGWSLRAVAAKTSVLNIHYRMKNSKRIGTLTAAGKRFSMRFCRRKARDVVRAFWGYASAGIARLVMNFQNSNYFANWMIATRMLTSIVLRRMLWKPPTNWGLAQWGSAAKPHFWALRLVF